MTARTGEKAKKTADYQCQECDASITVQQGQTIPACACGCKDFNEQAKSANTSTSTSHRSSEQK